MPRVSARSTLIQQLPQLIVGTKLSATSDVRKQNLQYLSLLVLISKLQMLLMMGALARQVQVPADATVFDMFLCCGAGLTIMQTVMLTLSHSLRAQRFLDVKQNEDLMVAMLFRALVIAKSSRYVQPRIGRVRLISRNLAFDAILNHQVGWAFIRYARMSRANFDFLVSRIETSEIFANSSHNPQVPVSWQLIVALAHLGLPGGGGGVPILAKTFEISEGSVENYTNRCIFAIMELEKDYVTWPTANEKAVIKEAIGSSSVFSECIGFVDGTIIPLAFAPVLHKEDYWMRKMMYGLNSLIVCDHRRRVLFGHHGWCGSVHDQRVYRSSRLFTQLNAYFSRGEYLLADSGYTASKTVIPALKRPHGGSLSRPKNGFNNHLSIQRVAVEHAIGMIKNRWQSMRDLRLIIRDQKSAARAVFWIRACCVLHNFLLSQNDEAIPYRPRPSQDSDSSDEEEEQETLGDMTHADDSKRSELYQKYLNSEYAHH